VKKTLLPLYDMDEIFVVPSLLCHCRQLLPLYDMYKLTVLSIKAAIHVNIDVHTGILQSMDPGSSLQDTLFTSLYVLVG